MNLLSTKQLYVAVISLLLLCCPPFKLTAAEPQWHYPEWQKPLVDWLKSISIEDVEMDPVGAVVLPSLSEAEAHRYKYAALGPDALLRQVSSQMETPASSFLWVGGVWRESEALVQPALKDDSHGLETGQIWIPGHPNAANILAWAYACDEPWNPYYGVEAVINRAAIISIVDLLMRPEERFYNGDATSSKEGKRWSTIGDTWGMHPGLTGFSLTFNAFTLLHAKTILTSKEVDAWGKGLRLYCEKLEDGNHGTGPGNMLLSVPVGMYYCYLATGSKYFKDIYHVWEDRIVTGDLFSEAGDYYDGFGRAPDGSYNGIALHRVAELYSINPTEKLRQVLEKAYRLKGYLTLPELNGDLISPSHFNDRSPSGFATDQYMGREVQFGAVVPEAAPFLRRIFEERIDVSLVANAIVSSIGNPTSRSPGPMLWDEGAGHTSMFDWERVKNLPFVMYPDDYQGILNQIEYGPDYALLEDERFTENLGNQYVVVRRPKYYCILYMGQAVEYDKGGTNSGGSLSGKGGYFNGFAGGGLSAFWTPQAGTNIIGRMSATEGYERAEVNGRFVPGWIDWANNHIVGETKDGKVLTSARTSWPASRFEKNGEGVWQLDLMGEFVTELARQGVIIQSRLHYARNYKFYDSRVRVRVELRSGQNVEFKSLHETIPVHYTDDLEIQLLDEIGSEILLMPVVEGVKYIVLKRQSGGTCIIMEEAATIDLTSVSFETKQQGPVVPVRAIQISFPSAAIGLRDIKDVNYDIVPFAGTWTNENIESHRREAYEEDSNSLFQPVLRENLLESVGEFDNPIWEKLGQLGGLEPEVNGSSIKFDVAGTESGISRIGQILNVESGSDYMVWVKLKSKQKSVLRLVMWDNNAGGWENRAFEVGPSSPVEDWFIFTPKTDQMGAAIDLKWGAGFQDSDFEKTIEVEILEWRVEKLNPNDNSLMTLPGALGPVPMDPANLLIQ